MPPIVIAHRTCPRDAPENSIAGIRVAADAKADAVEIDVRLTRDGVPVLMHDATLWRTTGKLRRVRSQPAGAIARLRFRGASSDDDIERVGVPTLDAALSALPAGLRLAMDIKDARAGPATLAAVRRHRAEDRVLWWSQHDEPLQVAARDGTVADRGLLRDTRPGRQTAEMLEDALRLGAGAVSVHWDVVDSAMLDEAHGRGLRVYSWCQWFDRHQEKAGLPLDGVVTDWPAEARRVLGNSAN